MSANIIFNGNTISVASGTQKTMLTANKYVAHDIIVQAGAAGNLSATVQIWSPSNTAVTLTQTSSGYSETVTSAANGLAQFTVYNGGVFTATAESCVPANITVAQVITNSLDVRHNVGGKICYVYSSGSANSYYRFFKSDGTEILDKDNITALNDAVYYVKANGATTDRYYVSSQVCTKNLSWGSSGVNTNVSYGTVDGLGQGKRATVNMITFTSMNGWSQSVWNCIRGYRVSNYNGCSDWFIGSKTDYDCVRTYIMPVMSTLFTYSSVEYSPIYAYYSVNGSTTWGTIGPKAYNSAKAPNYGIIPLRSF